ncbi:hypothetical protein As57867_006772, partial [Aphanomyces stellatus]
MFQQDTKKQRTTGVPKFLRHLYSILTNEDPSIISWSVDGTAIQLFHVKRLENEVLQLNYFGFRKWTKTQSCVCTFSHAQLNRYSAPDSMAITRKQQQHTSNTLGSPSSTDSNLVWSDAEDDMFSDQDMCAIELSDLDVKVD